MSSGERRASDDVVDVVAGTESEGSPRQVEAAATTVGTGSALGVGCVLALAVFVILALAARWLLGAW